MKSKIILISSVLAGAALVGCANPRLNPLQQDCLTRSSYDEFGRCMKSAVLMVAPFTNQNNLDLYKLYAEQIDKYGRDVADGIVDDQAARNYLATFYLDVVHYANTRALKGDMVQGAIHLNDATTEIMRVQNNDYQNRLIVPPPVTTPKASTP